MFAICCWSVLIPALTIENGLALWGAAAAGEPAVPVPLDGAPAAGVGKGRGGAGRGDAPRSLAAHPQVRKGCDRTIERSNERHTGALENQKQNNEKEIKSNQNAHFVTERNTIHQITA